MHRRAVPIDWLSFDLDGTLVDTLPEIAEAANRALEGIGMADRPSAEIAELIGAGGRELMLRLLSRIDVGGAAVTSARRDAAVEGFARHYAELAGSRCEPYAGVVDALQRLKAAGVGLACVTNKNEREARVVLGRSAMIELFAAVIGGDTLAVKKPDGRTIGCALERLGGLPQRAAHLGDSQTDVDTARNAGVAAWVVPYGYNNGMPIARAGADRVFADIAAVADHVLMNRP